MSEASGKANLRVLVLSHMYPSRVHESAGVFIHRHVQALRHAGVDARVVSPLPWAPRVLWFRPEWRQFGETPLEDTWEGVPVRRVRYPQIPLRGLQPWAGRLMSYPLAWALRDMRREFPFQLIHSHTVTPDGLAALRLGRVFDVPTVNSARGSDLNEYPHTHVRRMAFTRQVLRETGRCLAVSQALSKVAAGYTDGQVRPEVVYNGVDQTVFRPAEDRNALRRALDLPTERKVLVFVGRCERDKGVEELLEAFLAVRSQFPDWVLLCVGDGGFRAELLSRISAFSADQVILAPGRVEHAKVASMLRSADAFVLPSWAEGMPNGLLEAMACGLPCVATRVGGIPEVLRDGENGLLVEARSQDDLSRALGALMSDPVRAKGWGQRALETIARSFSWENNAHTHLRIYHELLDRHAVRSVG
ncbi:MAG: glycosyltransferase [Candidatus Delongbacteria bacterium]|nr:glycosyltransferase [Candidatus Cloacimonadota bacterium]MCB9472477.1 glycosyltransferase [Candidatus Delongbacteria bacterium]